MKKLILAALVGAALALGGVAAKQKLDDSALNSIKAEYAGSEVEPVCLSDGETGGFVILDADKEANVYRGIRIVLFLQLPFELPAREINKRDLKKVDCRTGQ